MRVTIYGYGWVGKAMHSLFPDAQIHDPDQDRYAPLVGDVAFVCVPTPNPKHGALDCSIVADVVRMAAEPLIIVRSTVNPGTCDALAAETGKAIVYQPEYLGETVGHPMLNQQARPFLILGGPPSQRRQAIDLYQQVYSANVTIRQLTRREAEVVKLTENRMIALKVAACQELFDACEADGIDYYTIREAVFADDPRFNLWWTFVYREKRGFNSKCIPKDVYAWAAWAEAAGIVPDVTRGVLAVNARYLEELTPA